MSRRSDHHRSVQHSSDMLVDITCSPCGEDGLQEEAVKYCPECQEYLCTACTKCHQRMKATREHKLLGARQAKQNPAVVKRETREKCWHHPDRDIEMYCRTHDMVYCTRCIATEHRTCSGVTDLDHATKENYCVAKMQSLLTETDEVLEQLVDVAKKKQKHLEVTEEQKTKIHDRIKEIQEEMVEHIVKLGTEAAGILKEKYTEVENDFESGESQVSRMIKKIEERKKKLGEAVSLSKGEKFVQVKLCEKAKYDAKKLYKECKSKPSKSIHFNENKQLHDSVMKVHSFGQIVEVEQQQKLRKVEIKTDQDEFCCLIADICQLKNGTIILVDQRNRKLKMLDKNYTVSGFWRAKGEPTGICCIGRNEIAVKYKHNKVMFENVSEMMLDTSRDAIHIEDGNSWGIVYFAGDLWMSYRGGVRVYSIDGVLMRDICCIEDHTGYDALNAPVHLSVCKRSIFIANGLDGVVCLDDDCSLKYTLEDERLKGTRGVYVTSRGTVFISGFLSNNMVMFSKDGQCIGERVNENMMPEKGPGALLFDHTKNCLLMTYSNSDYFAVVEGD